MPLFQRRPELPADLHPAWRAFLDCAEVIEGGRRLLLGTLPAGRVEPAPVAVGIEGLRRAIADARSWMPNWRVEPVADDWLACHDALHEAEGGLDRLATVAATTSELEELLGATEAVVAPLDAFADAERAWRRTWRLPR